MAYDGCTSARDEPKKFPEIFRMFVALNRSQNISGMLLEINIIVTLQTGLSNQYPLNSEFLRDLTSKFVKSAVRRLHKGSLQFGCSSCFTDTFWVLCDCNSDWPKDGTSRVALAVFDILSTR